MQTVNNRVVFFDIYQTLIDIDIDEEHKKENEAKGREVFAMSLERYGAHITPAGFFALIDERKEYFYAGKDKKVYHHNLCKIVMSVLQEYLGINISEIEVASLLSEYHKIARGYAMLYSGVVETLAELEKHYTLAVASYTQGCYTQAELKDLGIERFCSHFIYTSDVGFLKASPEFYKRCLDIVGKEAKNCMMIGDNYDVDILVPQKLGMKTIWVKNPLTAGHYMHLFEQEPKYMIMLDEFSKLPEIVGRVFREREGTSI